MAGGGVGDKDEVRGITHVLGNAVVVRLQERGEGAFAAAWGADKYEDALLRRGGKACGAGWFCSFLHGISTTVAAEVASFQHDVFCFGLARHRAGSAMDNSAACAGGPAVVWESERILGSFSVE